MAGPGGVYIFSSVDDYELLGFLRIDDFLSNTFVGGGYLWITANQRLLRVPLAMPATESPTIDRTSSAPLLMPEAMAIGLVVTAVFQFL